MVNLIIELLNMDDYEGVSDSIDIAKGKYELKLNLREAWKQHKRYN